MNKDNINRILSTIPTTTTIIAATKYVGSSEINELVNYGINNIGENRVEAFTQKNNDLSNLDIEWHFIGTLQSKKVKKIINKIDYLHSLDRLKLADEIQKYANEEIKCFIEVKTSSEDTKHGLLDSELKSFVVELEKYDKIKVVGLMTMAPFTEDEKIIRKCFSKLRILRDEIKNMNIKNAPCEYLSMGMSSDYLYAIEEGATHVRIGQALFKE